MGDVLLPEFCLLPDVSLPVEIPMLSDVPILHDASLFSNEHSMCFLPPPEFTNYLSTLVKCSIMIVVQVGMGSLAYLFVILAGQALICWKNGLTCLYESKSTEPRLIRFQLVYKWISEYNTIIFLFFLVLNFSSSWCFLAEYWRLEAILSMPRHTVVFATAAESFDNTYCLFCYNFSFNSYAFHECPMLVFNGYITFQRPRLLYQFSTRSIFFSVVTIKN